jgi:hypothetical protein
MKAFRVTTTRDTQTRRRYRIIVSEPGRSSSLRLSIRLRAAFVVLLLPLALAAGVSIQPKPVLAATRSAGALSLGAISVSGSSFTVSGCSKVSASLSGAMSVQPAQGRARGLVMFFAGGYGTMTWTGGTTAAINLLSTLNQAGYETVQSTWSQPGWEPASPGEDAGPGHTACRTATFIAWVHDNLYVPLNVPTPGLGVCGFCITGSSGGASEVSYAVAFYGLAPSINGVFPISGPPHAAEAKGCLQVPGYAYAPLAQNIIDQSFGYYNGTGPCTAHSASFTSRWNQESTDSGGCCYYYPTTRVHFIFGQNDFTGAVKEGGDYVAKLQSSGSPLVTEETISGMSHEIRVSTLGMTALQNTIEAGASGVPRTSPPVSSPPPVVGTPGQNGPPALVRPSPRNPGLGVSSPVANQPVPASSPIPLRGLGGTVAAAAAAITGRSAERAWIWITVVGLALAFAAIGVIPRVPRLRRRLVRIGVLFGRGRTRR